MQRPRNPLDVILAGLLSLGAFSRTARATTGRPAHSRKYRARSVWVPRLLILAAILWGLGMAFLILGSVAAAAATPIWCKPLQAFERTCVGVKAATAALGRRRAELLAKNCGATPDELAQARACLDGDQAAPVATHSWRGPARR